jgi:hypothetical protein
MKKIDIKNQIQALESKYCDLVWFARSGPANIDIKGVKEAKLRIEKAHSKEINQLLHGETDWEHGFNSGMLAGMRYVIDLFENNKQTADERFPFLDS